MSENQTLFRQLENTLRSRAAQSNWLFLEPVDESLQRSIRDALAELQPEKLPAETGSRRLIDTVLKPDLAGQQAETNHHVSGQTGTPEIRNMDPMNAGTLDSLRLRLRDCERCTLCRDRNKIVFGQGNIKADLVFVGEGPGADEDKSGIAFVGRAGKLLTQMIHAIGINRESVYICNVVKCRPPGNRNPSHEEISTCSPFLFKQLEILDPRLIVTMGNIATKTLLPHAYGIMKMRGKLTSFQGIPLIPTFHPSYLLRNPAALGMVWNDMKQIRQVLFQQQPQPAESDE